MILFMLLILGATLPLSAIDSPIKTGFARLQYEGGGDWYNDPEVLPNLARFVNKHLSSSIPIDQSVVKASDTRLFDFPFVYHRPWQYPFYGHWAE